MKTNKAGNSKDRNKSSTQKGQPQNHAHPNKAHTSQGHTTDEDGTVAGNPEPTLRGSTTDSSRTHKNPHDDMPTGGNIR